MGYHSRGDQPMPDVHSDRDDRDDAEEFPYLWLRVDSFVQITRERLPPTMGVAFRARLRSHRLP